LLALAREDNSVATQTRLLPVVEQSIIQQHQFLTDKDIELIIEIKPQQDVPMAKAPLLILLNNLIGNAFKYTRHSAVFLGINFLIDTTHAINDNTVPLFHI
jgi:signal transduction histidine kinase